MMDKDKIVPITMPKWGLSMTEGKVVGWLVDEGRALKPGDPVMDIETEKIANTFEALDAGTLRRKIAQVDDVLPIGALLGVLAPAEVQDAEVDAYVAEFQANYVPPAAEEGEEGPDYRYVDVGGQRLRYARRGETGPAVVLIHGFGGDCDNWLFNLDALAAGARVHALDLPGHGQSSKTIADGSIDALARTVLGFLDAVDVDAAHLVGHSLGGAIALVAAAAAPARVRALSLIAPAGLGPTIDGDYLREFIAAESRRELKPVLQRLVADAGLVNRQMIDDVLKYKRLDGVGDALRAIANGFVDGNAQRVDLRPVLNAVGCPVQLLWGSADRIVPPAQAEGLPASVAVHLIDGAGHLPHLEAASAVNALLKRMTEGLA
ncbi:MAG: acetoin dehydrogenase dihydrolipoyllysine-residue acetyltransferase subunit [Gammaproteobacteria bacterium]